MHEKELIYEAVGSDHLPLYPIFLLWPWFSKVFPKPAVKKSLLNARVWGTDPGGSCKQSVHFGLAVTASLI